MEQKNNENRRYVAKVKERRSKEGNVFYVILADNPNPSKEDPATGQQVANPYWKGNLMWFDNKTNKYYKVKQLRLRGVSERDSANGFTNSICFDLDNSHDAEEMS